MVLVSGAPGAGKTTLAVPLAAELGFTLLCKDRIKETLHDGLGAPEPDLAWSRRLGAAAMELLWALAADAPAVVLEANFRPRSAYERGRISALPPAPGRGALRLPARAGRPAVRRARRGPPPCTRGDEPGRGAAGRFDRPVGIGDLITVDTTVPVDVAAAGRPGPGLLADPSDVVVTRFR